MRVYLCAMFVYLPCRRSAQAAAVAVWQRRFSHFGHRAGTMAILRYQTSATSAVAAPVAGSDLASAEAGSASGSPSSIAAAGSLRKWSRLPRVHDPSHSSERDEASGPGAGARFSRGVADLRGSEWR